MGGWNWCLTTLKLFIVLLFTNGVAGDITVPWLWLALFNLSVYKLLTVALQYVDGFVETKNPQ